MASRRSSTRSQLRVRNISAGVVYNLVFDGSLDQLSGAQLRTHLQGISEVPVACMDLFVELPSSSPPQHSDGGDGVSDRLTRLFTDRTRGAELGLRDGSTVYMRVQPQRGDVDRESVRQDRLYRGDAVRHGASQAPGTSTEGAPSSEAYPTHRDPTHQRRTGQDVGGSRPLNAAPATSVGDVPQSRPRLAPPSPAQLVKPSNAVPVTSPDHTPLGRPSAATAATAWSPQHASSAARPHTRSPHDASHRREHGGGSSRRRPSSTRGRSRDRSSTRTGRGVRDSQDPRDGEDSGRTRIVVAAPWDVLSALPPSHADVGSTTARTSAGAKADATRHKQMTTAESFPEHSDDSPPSASPKRNASVIVAAPESKTNARRRVPPARPSAAKALCANDLEELFAEQDYVWRMERYRFNAERESRRQLIEERLQQCRFDTTRLTREERLWASKLALEQSRLQSVQAALELEVDAMAERLAHRGREIGSSPLRLSHKAPSLSHTRGDADRHRERTPVGGAALFDGDVSEEITVDVEPDY